MSEQRRGTCWAVPLLVVAATAWAFAPSLDNGFVNFDDEARFLKNKAYMGLGLRQLRWVFFDSFRTGNYEPLSWLTYAGAYAASGLDAGTFHAIGIVAHAATVLFFYLMTLELVGGPATPSRLAAAGAALLFAVHPLRVEAVTWISGQHYPLAGAPLLASVWFYLKAFRAGAAAQGAAARRWLRSSIVAAALSLLAYPIGMALPAVLLLLDIHPLGRLPVAPSRWSEPRFRPVWLEKLPFAALSAAAMTLAMASRLSQRHVLSIEHHSLAARLAQTGYAVVMHLLQTLDPVHWPPSIRVFRLGFDFLNPTFLACFLAAAALTWAALRERARRPWLGAAWGIYLATLLPVSGLVQTGSQVIADRYTYISGMGFPVLVAAGLLRLRGQGGERRFRWGLLAVALAAVGLARLTRAQTRIWRDSTTLWRTTLAMDPENPVAHENLGISLLSQDRLTPEDAARGTRHIQEAMRLQPALPGAVYAMGLADLRLGRPDAAHAAFRRAAAMDPANGVYHNALGVVLTKTGRTREAVSAFSEALRLRPDNVEARFNLALALSELGRWDEARAQYAETVSIYPDLWEAHFNLAELLNRRPGDADLAAGHYREVLRIRPGNADALNNLGVIARNQGHAGQARALFQAALAAQPGHGRASANLKELGSHPAN